MPLLALIIAWALLHTVLVTAQVLPAAELGPLDPDSFMRMVRVLELVQGGGWFDTTIERANAPYGDALHWTRPFDVLLILLAQPMRFFLGEQSAYHLAGVLVSPLLQLSAALLMVWALRPLTRRGVWFLPVVALLVQPGALAYSLAGRSDHHSLLFLVFVVVAGFMLHALRNGLDSRPALYGGLAAGFGIWLSVEFLLVVALCLAAFGLPWLLGERERAAQAKWFALGMSLITLAALFIERPLGQLLDPSYDRISSVHYLLVVCILLFWRGVETLDARDGAASGFVGRATTAIVGAGAIGLLVNAIYPLFFAGPMAEVDPRIVPIWLDRVLEMRPLLPHDEHTLGFFILFLGSVVLVVPMLAKILIDDRHSDRFYGQLFILLACLILSAAALRHMRFSGYPEIAFILAFGVVFDAFLRWSGRIGNDLPRGFLRGGFIALMLLGPPILGASLMIDRWEAKNATAQAQPSCEVAEVAAYLEQEPRWVQAPQTILTFMDIGPELLYRTRHRVIGTPYHRNGDGIFDGREALATSDDTLARSIIDRRRVDLVLLCGSDAERNFYAAADGKENLYSRLQRNSPPVWLAPVTLPAELAQGTRLYRVLR